MSDEVKWAPNLAAALIDKITVEITRTYDVEEEIIKYENMIKGQFLSDNEIEKMNSLERGSDEYMQLLHHCCVEKDYDELKESDYYPGDDEYEALSYWIEYWTDGKAKVIVTDKYGTEYVVSTIDRRNSM